MNTPTAREILARAVGERAARRGLNADLDRIRYANNYLYTESGPSDQNTTLYVGVGHGHDAMLALIDELTGEITGVDPYIGDHGNDDQDFEALVQLISELSLENRFTVQRNTVQSYLDGDPGSFDRIVCSDVLHHIFEESVPLTQSPEFDAAVALFKRFRAITRPGGSLVISDAGRHGLRQLIHQAGLNKFRGNYQNKQPWQQWDAALVQAGWRRTSLHNYIPFPLRQYSKLFSGLLGRYTVCEHYVLSYRHDG